MRGCIVYTLEDLGLVGGPPDPVLNHLVKMASRVCGVQAGMFNIRDETTSTIFCQAHCCLEGWYEDVFEIPEESSLTSLVCEQNMIIAVEDARTDPRVSDGCGAVRLRFRAMMGAPILGPDSAPVGALTVCSPHPKAWTDRERDSLRSMAVLGSQHVMLRATIATLKILKDEAGLKTA